MVKLGGDVQGNYVAGGGAGNLPVRVSALVRGKTLHYPDYAEFNFQSRCGSRTDRADGEEEADATRETS